MFVFVWKQSLSFIVVSTVIFIKSVTKLHTRIRVEKYVLLAVQWLAVIIFVCVCVCVSMFRDTSASMKNSMSLINTSELHSKWVKTQLREVGNIILHP
jgi:hypothetical protein